MNEQKNPVSEQAKRAIGKIVESIEKLSKQCLTFRNSFDDELSDAQWLKKQKELGGLCGIYHSLQEKALKFPKSSAMDNLSGLRENIIACFKDLLASHTGIRECEILDGIISGWKLTLASTDDANLALDVLSAWIDGNVKDDQLILLNNKLAAGSPSPETDTHAPVKMLEKIIPLLEKLPAPDFQSGNPAAKLAFMLANWEKSCITSLTETESYLDQSDRESLRKAGHGNLQKADCSENGKTARRYYEGLFSPTGISDRPNRGRFDNAMEGLYEEMQAYDIHIDYIKNKYINNNSRDLPRAVADKIINRLVAEQARYSALIDELNNLDVIVNNPGMDDKERHASVMKRREDGVAWRGDFERDDYKSLSGLKVKIESATVEDGWKKGMTGALKNAAVTGKLDREWAEKLGDFLGKAITKKQKAEFAGVIAKLEKIDPRDGAKLTLTEIKALLPVPERALTESEAKGLLGKIAERSSESLKYLSGELEKFAGFAEKEDPAKWPPALGKRFQSRGWMW